jgi:hypothetical protein
MRATGGRILTRKRLPIALILMVGAAAAAARPA